MLTVSLRVEKNIIGKVKADIAEHADRVVMATAYRIQERAQSLAPVDTGNLKNSIHVERLGKAHAIVATNVEYAVYQEYGTVDQAGTPFMTPAAEAERPAFLEAMRQLGLG